MRNRRFVWREIKQVLRVDAPKKIDQIKVLIDKLFENEDSKRIMDNWGLKIEKTPAKHRGFKLDPGFIIMGPKAIAPGTQEEERISHDIDISGSDIGIKLQHHKLFD